MMRAAIFPSDNQTVNPMDKLQELEAKYNRLLDFVYKMRNRQKEYFKYRASSDLTQARRLERVVDEIVSDEIKQRKSMQLRLE
jgi:hypothetical protein